MLTSLGVLIQPYLTKLLIDDGLIARDYRTLVTVAASIFLVGIAATLLSGINRYFYTRESGRILFRLRERVYGHLQSLSPDFYATHRSGDVLARLDGDVAALQRFAVDTLFAGVSAVLGLVGTIGFMLYLNWQLTLIVVALTPLQWSYLRFMRPRVQARTRTLRERASDVSSFLVETIPAMKTVQEVAGESRQLHRLSRLNRQYLDSLLRLNVTEFATSAVPNTLTSAGRTAVFLIGGWQVVSGDMAVGSLIAFSTYLGMAIGPIQGILGIYMSLARVRVSLERVQYLLQFEASVLDTGKLTPPPVLRNGIQLVDVDFSYPGGPPVLHGVSMTLPAGCCVGVHSPSGSGKTTLVDLLMRFYDPDRGSIRADGVDIREFMLGAWRRQIALVAQDVTLFRGSILDNVRLARPDASRDAIERAVAQARLSALLARLPDGLDTPLGERGAKLSGGERQRIAIARALLQSPQILILDEATSAIDTDTEDELIEMVNQAFSRCTRMIISHRESTLRWCDHRLEIIDGSAQLKPVPPP